MTEYNNEVEEEIIEDNPITQTIIGLENYKDTLSMIFSILAVLCVIVAIISFSPIMIVLIVSILITKFIINIFLGWMTYMLQTNYEILKELKKINLNK